MRPTVHTPGYPTGPPGRFLSVAQMSRTGIQGGREGVAREARRRCGVRTNRHVPMASPSACAARVNVIETLELLPGLDLAERVGYLMDNKKTPGEAGRGRPGSTQCFPPGKRKELGVSVHVYAGYFGCQPGW